MSRVTRIQLRFQTQEGGQVTSTELEIAGMATECITVASFKSLLGHNFGDDELIQRSYRLTMIEKDGVNWVTCLSALPRLALTVQQIRATITES